MQIKERDIMLEDLREVIEDKQANACLVCGTDDEVEPFLIEGNLQEKDLFDAFVPDDALKHRNVRHTCYMQDP